MKRGTQSARRGRLLDARGLRRLAITPSFSQVPLLRCPGSRARRRSATGPLGFGLSRNPHWRNAKLPRDLPETPPSRQCPPAHMTSMVGRPGYELGRALQLTT